MDALFKRELDKFPTLEEIKTFRIQKGIHHNIYALYDFILNQMLDSINYEKNCNNLHIRFEIKKTDIMRDFADGKYYVVIERDWSTLLIVLFEKFKKFRPDIELYSDSEKLVVMINDI
jgi:hypothetical protein